MLLILFLIAKAVLVEKDEKVMWYYCKDDGEKIWTYLKVPDKEEDSENYKLYKKFDKAYIKYRDCDKTETEELEKYKNKFGKQFICFYNKH